MQPKSSLFQRPGMHRGAAVPSSPATGDALGYMERENDEVLRALRDDVKSLKGISAAIGKEVQDQNKFLDVLHASMDAARNGLKGTMKKLDQVSAASGVSHMWLLLIFMFGVFLFIFLLLKFRS